MRVIDLLNKIANGENIKKVKYQNHIYEYYNGDYREYFDGDYDSIWLFASEIIDLSKLNDEIEIIEETNENKISPDDVKNLGRAIGNLQRLFESGYEEGLKEPKKIEKINRNRYIGTDIDMTDDILDKLDEIIDYINKGEE